MAWSLISGRRSLPLTGAVLRVRACTITRALPGRPRLLLLVSLSQADVTFFVQPFGGLFMSIGIGSLLLRGSLRMAAIPPPLLLLPLHLPPPLAPRLVAPGLQFSHTHSRAVIPPLLLSWVLPIFLHLAVLALPFHCLPLWHLRRVLPTSLLLRPLVLSRGRPAGPSPQITDWASRALSLCGMAGIRPPLLAHFLPPLALFLLSLVGKSPHRPHAPHLRSLLHRICTPHLF